MSKQAEETIKRVNATLELEGLSLTEDDKVFLAKYIDGEYSMDEALNILKIRFSNHG